MRNRLLVAAVLGLLLGVTISDSLVRSKLTPATRHYAVLLWSFPVYEEDQPALRTADGGIDITLREPLFAQVLRLGVVLLFVGVGVLTAYRFGYAMLFWVLFVLLVAEAIPRNFVQSVWKVGERNVAVTLFSFRVYEADNGWGVNNENGPNEFIEPVFAPVLRLVLALLVIGVGALMAYTYRNNKGNKGEGNKGDATHFRG